MELRMLRHAVVLQQERTFVRAASKLHISQPALSQSIARLEKEVGLRLFDRDRAGVILTEAGKAFITRARQLLIYARDVERDMAAIRNGDTAEVTFGMGPLPAACWLTDLLHHFVTQKSGWNIRAEIERGDDLVENLVAGRLEFLIASHNYASESPLLSIRPVATLRMSVFGRAEHPLTAKRKVRMAELSAFPLLAPGMRAGAGDPWSYILKDTPERPRTGMVYCNAFHTLKDLTLSSNSLLLAPLAAVARECSNGTLVQLAELPGRESNVKFIMATQKNRTLSPAAEMVIAKIMDLV